MSKSNQVKEIRYDSNPFTLAFGAFGRFFNSNTSWAVVILVLSTIGFIFQSIGNVFNPTTENNTSTGVEASSSPDIAVIAAVAILIIGISFFVVVIGTAIQAFIQGIFTYVALKSEEGKSVSFVEAFEAVSKRFWRLYLAHLLAVVKIIGWTLLFIVPGIIAALRYSMLTYQIMAESDKEKGVIDSHTKTIALSKGRLMEVFGVSIVGALIPVVGPLLDISGKAALFNQLNYYNQKNLQKPGIHWLNYLCLGLLALFILVIFIIAFVAVILSIVD